jgi:hypothetical protein
MSHITKLAAIETTSAIWEYDPSASSNRLSGGGLDVIATICTLAIKVRGVISILHSNDVHAIDTSFWPANSKIRIPPG